MYHSSSMWFVPWLEPNGANQNVNIRFVPHFAYLVRTNFDILGSHHICKMWCEPFGTNHICIFGSHHILHIWFEPLRFAPHFAYMVRTTFCIKGSYQMVRTTFCKCGANLKCQIWFVPYMLNLIRT